MQPSFGCTKFKPISGIRSNIMNITNEASRGAAAHEAWA